jgi:hypothetical protein
MPPQQAYDLLDFGDCLVGLGTHRQFLVTVADVDDGTDRINPQRSL